MTQETEKKIYHTKISVNYKIMTESPQVLMLQNIVKCFFKITLLVLVAGGGVRAGGCGLGTPGQVSLLGFPVTFHDLGRSCSTANILGGEKY